MDTLTQTLLAEIGQSFGHSDNAPAIPLTVSGQGSLTSAFQVSELEPA